MKVKMGDRIKIISSEYNEEEHCVVEDAKYTESNDVVPYEIQTCCGLYRPTSSADGYWDGELRLGRWEIIGSLCETGSKEKEV